MDVDSNANTNEDAPPPPSPPHSPSRHDGSERLESASRAAQDLMGMMETKDQAAGSTTAATMNTTSTTNHENCTTTGISAIHALDELSSDNQQGNKAETCMSRSATCNNSNIASFSSTVRGDDQPTESDNNSDIEQPTEHTKRNSTIADDVISIKVGQGCLLPPSFIGVLDNETEESRQRRRAVFAAKRQRHVLADNLHAHYEAILAAAIDVTEGGEQQELQPQQDDNNEDNAASFHQNTARPARHIMAVAMDLFMAMETDGDEEDKSE